MKLASWEMLKVCVLFLRSNNSAILKETKGSVPNQSFLQNSRWVAFKRQSHPKVMFKKIHHFTVKHTDFCLPPSFRSPPLNPCNEVRFHHRWRPWGLGLGSWSQATLWISSGTLSQLTDDVVRWHWGHLGCWFWDQVFPSLGQGFWDIIFGQEFQICSIFADHLLIFLDVFAWHCLLRWFSHLYQKQASKDEPNLFTGGFEIRVAEVGSMKSN